MEWELDLGKNGDQIFGLYKKVPFKYRREGNGIVYGKKHRWKHLGEKISVEE